MRIPRKVPITDDVTYTVKFVKQVEPIKVDRRRRGSEQERETIGLCDGVRKIIYIKTKLHPEQRLETFWHEVVHAIEFEHGFRFAERFVISFERPLAKVFAYQVYQLRKVLTESKRCA